jgi:hypothetical protein
VSQGWYQFNPQLQVRRRTRETETWVPIFQALNLPFIHEFARDELRERIAGYLALARMPGCAVAVAAERALAQAETERREQEERAERLRREYEERLAARERALLPDQTEEPKWGTPEAKRREIERLRAKIAANRKR